LKLTKKANQNKFLFGYDSRTGLNGVLEGLDKLCSEDVDEKKIIEVFPDKIIPSIEHTVSKENFEFFKTTILEKGSSYNCEISFSEKWKKTLKIEEPKEEKETLPEKIRNSSDLLKKQLLRKKPITLKEELKQPSTENKEMVTQIRIDDINKNKDAEEIISQKQVFSSFEKNVRCGFEEVVTSNSLINKQINKSGKLKVSNCTCIIEVNNMGIIDSENATLIFKSNIEKGIVIFNGENITEKLFKEKSYVVFSENGKITIETL
jgi:hypothetical protein